MKSARGAFTWQQEQTTTMEGRHEEYKKGLWNVEEDRVLMDYVKEHGIGKWNRIAKVTGIYIS